MKKSMVLIKHYYCSNCYGGLRSSNDNCEVCVGQEKLCFIRLPLTEQLQELYATRAEIAQLVPKFQSGPDQIFHMWPQGGTWRVARVRTTSDYDRQDYFQILCSGRDIVMTILKLKCQKQNVHGEFGSTESLVRFLISAL